LSLLDALPISAAGHRHRRCLHQPPVPPALHRAVGAAAGGEPPAGGVGPVPVGAEHLGRPQSHREDRERSAQHAGSRLQRHDNGGAVIRKKAKELAIPRWRYQLILLLLELLPVAALWHIAGLQVISGDRGYEFLQGQGNARTVRTESIPAYRGLITDRRGEPLAVSTPVVSLWANPKVLDTSSKAFETLAARLDLDLHQIRERVARFRTKEFMYLARHLTPAEAEELLDLKVQGVYGQQEYKRFYPAGEVAAQLIGFTNIDDQGQEGIELAYERALAGDPGAKRVVKDMRGRVIKDVGLIRSEKPGKDLTLSIDLRLQYLAHRELKDAMARYQADSGSVVMLDARSGEVLAMVNQPAYNPNNRIGVNSNALRNRAMTDLVEPGSTMKPLTIAAALESGKYTPTTPMDTNPGYIWA